MRDVVEMAQEAGIISGFDTVHPSIERFAELVRADEREQGQRWFDAVTAQHKQAILAEREACAKVCEELLERPSGYQGTWEGYGKFKTQMTGQECAAAIRARSNT